MLHHSTRARRHLAQVVVLASVAATLALAPTPEIAYARDVAIRTDSVRLPQRTASRAHDEIADEGGSAAAEAATRAGFLARGRRARARAVEEFRAIGLTFASAPAGPVFVRARADAEWTPWIEVEIGGDDAPDVGKESPNPGVHSEPVWVGAADAYEVDAPAGTDDVDVHLVREGPRKVRIVAEEPRAGAASGPPINGRGAWGARPPAVHPSTTSDLKLAIVHHSVHSNSYSRGDVPAMLRSIQAYHQSVNGWNDIAYNFVVDRFGRIWEARAGGVDKVVVGGHSRGFNTASTGVVVLGDFRSVVPSAAAVEAVSQVVAWKLAIHGVDPGSTVPYTTVGSDKYAAGTTLSLPRVIGHRDVQSTACPGAHLYGRIATIRTRVRQLVAGYQPLAPPQVLAGDIDGNGMVDPLEYRIGGTTDTQWVPTGSGGFTARPIAVNRPYRAATGDFDGNGRDDVLWHGLGTAPDVLWLSQAGGGVTARSLTVNGSYVPIVGDYDGDGRDDVFWYAVGPSPDSIWYFGAGGAIAGVAFDQDLITAIPVVGDFDATGRDDIMWYGPGTAADSLWRSTGRAFKVTPLTVNGRYLPAALSANGDARDDILWVAPGTTTAHRWDFGPVGSIQSRTLSVPAVDGRPTIGDFDGNGLDDALLFSTEGGADGIWYTTATGLDTRPLTITGAYTVVAGRMDGGLGGVTDDLLFVSSGADVVWRGNLNRTFSSAKVG
jgi:hypothetical protein